ncbi:hypothetical protein OHB56_33580 [Streptomyces sp. NBC_01635]|uniref:hypothetical protein n=1 Tax=Streptomyces sp. NBC_01635 TaxID=2975904 RepID=UPI00386EBF7B|nr:hypothetical protein OHB56_33580 [Streptomyces sp. NBC_01635]
MENTSPLPPNVPPRPSSAPATAGPTGEPYGWRDEYEVDPESQRILAAMESPWWKRPLTLWGSVVAVAVGSFFLGGAVLGTGDSSDPSSPSPWVQDQMDDQSQEGQQQDDQPAGLSYQEKQQILFKFCTSSQMRGGPGDSSAFPTCMGSYHVTDQGMVMPK